MGNETNQQQLMMFRRAAPVPETPLKPGWSMRSMCAGEEGAWMEICMGAGFFVDSTGAATASWGSVMGCDPGVRAENVFFACDPSGKPVATATARFAAVSEQGKFPPAANGLGYLHFVAALPESRGMGAGTAVTAEVLRRNEALGLRDCVLTTDDHRLAAIRIYLNLGWVPVLYAPDMRPRWERVLDGLNYEGELQAMDGAGAAAEPLRRAGG